MGRIFVIALLLLALALPAWAFGPAARGCCGLDSSDPALSMKTQDPGPLSLALTALFPRLPLKEFKNSRAHGRGHGNHHAPSPEDSRKPSQTVHADHSPPSFSTTGDVSGEEENESAPYPCGHFQCPPSSGGFAALLSRSLTELPRLSSFFPLPRDEDASHSLPFSPPLHPPQTLLFSLR
ncbi:MAG: hypothetical protein LBR53_03215 [Deltaproteobacteria bacterium]|nr:hypothetical protein [Deltaproteobacteria bacterium]